MKNYAILRAEMRLKGLDLIKTLQNNLFFYMTKMHVKFLV